ncbi:MAG: TerC family protein [Bacteroidota bacterium]
MMDFAEILTGAALLSLFTLTLMEIILGIDNIVFISIVVSKLPEEQQPRARTLGLVLALVFRLALLTTIKWIVTELTNPLFTIDWFGMEPLGISVKDLILLGGGLFLIGKSITEMHHKLEGVAEDNREVRANGFANVIFQIILIDIVFSFDSILTAVGLADQLLIMIIAVVISMIVMIIFSGAIADFINNRPTIKMLALSFLILIGFMLVLESLHQHIDKGYIYFAMAFSLVVELLNSRIRGTSEQPVILQDEWHDNDPD